MLPMDFCIVPQVAGGKEVALELIPMGTDLDGNTFYHLRVPTSAATAVRAFFEILRRTTESPEEYEALAARLRELGHAGP